MLYPLQVYISVRDAKSINYHLNYRNTFDQLVGPNYKMAKLDILIISLVGFQNPVTFLIQTIINDAHYK